MSSEDQHTEWKSSWRDEYLKWLCGFANAQGGVLEIGRNDKGQVVGIDDAAGLKAAVTYEDIVRIERFPVPREALREAVLNALVHRDYMNTAPIQIRVYDDRLVLWNPAVLPEGWTQQTLLEPHTSQPHNPDVANTFFRAGEIEAWGRGIERMFAACREAKTPEPQIRFDAGALQDVSDGWARIARESPTLARIGITAVVALILFGGARLEHVWTALRSPIHQPTPLWKLFLVVQMVVYAGFVSLSELVFRPESVGTWGTWLFAAWGGAGFLVLFFWAAALAPTRAWFSEWKSGLGSLLMAAAIGVVCVGAGRLTSQMWQPLGRGTLELVRALLGLVTSDVIGDPERLHVGTSSFSVLIAPECSGYEGIGMIWVFLGLYLWLDRKALRFPHVLLLLPLGTVIIWLANSLRIAALIVIGTWFSQGVALGGFHSQAGWLIFLGIALGTVMLTSRCRFFASVAVESPEPPDPASRNPVAPYLLPFLAILATTMLTGAFSHPGTLEWYYPLRVLGALLVLWIFRHAYRGMRWSCSWEAAGIGLVAAVIWGGLVLVRGEPSGSATWPTQLGELPVGWAVIWVVFRIAGYLITVPIAEELAFRGYLTRQLTASDFETVPLGQFSWPALLGSSIAFGLMHCTHGPSLGAGVSATPHWRTLPPMGS